MPNLTIRRRRFHQASRAARTALRGSALALALASAASAQQPHADFDRFLQRQVDPEGRIDYAAALEDSADLDRYVSWLARVSPDSHPAQFPRVEDQLAYWINAYNATVIRKVLDLYPIASVRDVRSRWLFFLPRLAGFFVIEKVELGGKKFGLRTLENKIIRKRFGEPRVHFALNCASRSCPKLARRAFTADALDAELARETRRFLSDASNFRVDTSGRRVFLSSIFEWYEGDYTDWLEREHADRPATLLNYLTVEAPTPETAAALANCSGCRVTFLDYDWGLNDRTGGD